jgi:hypothetical protein
VIRVEPAPEPFDFDAKVRQPGLAAIAELVGDPAPVRPGRARQKKAAQREDLRPDDFPPFWREALDDLLLAYRRICAYASLYIEPVTGAGSVDHMIPRSTNWSQVYEWSNYRLACSLMNSRKRDVSSLLDPFEIDDFWFGLELVEYRVVARERLPPEIETRVNETINRLGLNTRECCEARAAYGDEYLGGEISLERVMRRAPFVARELIRQGRLRDEHRTVPEMRPVLE